MKAKVKIDWDTVELVGLLAPVVPPPVEHGMHGTQAFSDRRGQSTVKKILSGASQKARGHGAIYSHTQLRKLLPTGLPTLSYGLCLVAAAMEGDLSRSIEIAAQVIAETAHRVLQRSRDEAR